MDTTKLTESEQYRYDIIRSCIDKDITNKEGAIRLGLRIRQIQNLKRKIGKEGKQGIRHGLSGVTAHNATDSRVKTKVKDFFKKKKHHDFGPTFAMEQLQKQQGIVLSKETIRLIMLNNGIWKAKKRKSPKIHREWRERMECFGELVQFDGSYHDWFETGKEACILAAIDDATGNIVQAQFEDNEGVLACFRFWKHYIEACGRPRAIYLDKFGTYKINHKSALDNPEWMTQFQRAMKELDIRVISAHSPEAKGRIERLFGTLQDRMVKEMRLARTKQKDANIFLTETYIPDHNSRFSVKARSDIDVHRPLTDEMKRSIDSICSIQNTRKVNNDYTVQYMTKWFQLHATQDTTVYKRDTVVVEERLDGTLHIRLKQTYLKYIELPERPTPIHMKVTALTRERPTWKPPENHPWKKFKI